MQETQLIILKTIFSVNTHGTLLEDLRFNTTRSIMKDLFIIEMGVFPHLLNTDIRKSIE